MCVITSDNLGSHCIGGFTENFSTSLYCSRYCFRDRATFTSTPDVIGQKRTLENYNEAVDKLKQDPELSESLWHSNLTQFSMNFGTSMCVTQVFLLASVMIFLKEEFQKTWLFVSTFRKSEKVFHLYSFEPKHCPV